MYQSIFPSSTFQAHEKMINLVHTTNGKSAVEYYLEIDASSSSWREFFADNEISDEDKAKALADWKKEIFKKEKSNLPPLGGKNLRNFLTGVKSELVGTKPNKIKSNISEDETEALAILIKLQRESVLQSLMI